jgi:hypothetical protein
LWINLSLNIGTNNKEMDYEICVIPNFADFNIQTRYFKNSSYSGFFYGPFFSLEYLKLSIIPGDEIGIQAEIGNSNLVGDEYYLVGLRYGGDIGFRLRIKNIGFTPKIGLAIPLFYCFNAQLTNKNDWLKFYGLNAIMRCIDFGFKIDFFQK